MDEGESKTDANVTDGETTTCCCDPGVKTAGFVGLSEMTVGAWFEPY